MYDNKKARQMPGFEGFQKVGGRQFSAGNYQALFLFSKVK
jgi:hypothetical protein